MSRRKLQGTLTVRLSARSLRELRRRAAAEGRTTSEVVREVVERSLEPAPAGGEPSLYERTRQWIGATSDPRIPHGAAAREELEGWEPDRRA